uniref:Protein transport protein sec16 n=1 Tax=Periophthalmus magnuspinnatus TaxID=409849 RepID=A0A3B3ZLQ4_9GOBI
MHQSQTQNQTSGHSSSLHDSQQCSNGFYLQVTKDLQQSVKAESNASVPTSGPSSSRPLAPSNPEPSIQQPTPEPTKSTASQSTLQSHTSAPPVAEAEAQSSGSMQAPVSAPPPAYPPGPHQPVSQSPGPTGGSQPLSGPPRPPSTAGSQQGYGPPAAVPPGVPGPGYRGYYSGNYGDYSDNRFYLPGQYPPPVADTRSQYYPPLSNVCKHYFVILKMYMPKFFVLLLIAPPRPATPEKFTMPHRCARFGPGGHMVQVLPNLPSAGQPALVDIHNLETMLQDTSAQAELRAFPGPLVKEDTHKVDVIKFSQNKALECSRDNNLLDRDSARLLWDFIVLLCRQNGTVVGTDIADLLLKEHRSVWLPGKSPNEANLIDFNNEPLSQAEEEPGAGPLSLLSDTFMTVPENLGKETERFRELLLFGRKKDALEAAMKSGLWGHALLLASKMDSRTHARVMTRFANSLPINDPLQTVYQLMSGRMPASCCGEEKWGDWRPHLAMVLSNLTHTLDLDTRTIATMGDTLASKGLIDAAHFCYLMAQVGLGVYTKKSTKMVLIGSNHSLSFYLFASNDAIQRTEAYEYAQSLGSHSCSLPNFQVYKFIYACRLAEAGLSAQAFHYCEVISKTVLMQPSYYSPIFLNQLIQMSEKLRFFDPQLKEKPEQELFKEPEWLIHLRQLDGQMRLLPPNDVPQFYPVPPTGPQGQIPYPGYAPHDPGYAPPQFPSQSEQVDLYPGGPTHMSPVPTHINTAMPPPSVQMNPPNAQMPPSPGHLQPVEHVQGPPLVQPGPTMSASPPRSSLTPQMDFYDQMVQMVCIFSGKCYLYLDYVHERFVF